jgi:quercetin dioxygenase-like cupin family protein
MTPASAVLVNELGSLRLEEAQPEIYDRPVALRLLYQDPASGAEHYLVQCPQGLRARPHRHSAAHTIIVLEGAMQLDGQLLRPGSYAHHPPGTVMHHAPAPGQHCLFLIIFHGPFDVVPLISPIGTGSMAT